MNDVSDAVRVDRQWQADVMREIVNYTALMIITGKSGTSLTLGYASLTYIYCL